jgi:hypothetical protein
MPNVHAQGLRLCTDDRDIKKFSIVNGWPLPIMTVLEDHICGNKRFTKIDLKNPGYLIYIQKVMIGITAVHSHYVLHEFLVISFRLNNAPPSFEDMMNDILQDLLEIGVGVYLDEILKYAKNIVQPDKLVEDVLERLHKNDLVIST